MPSRAPSCRPVHPLLTAVLCACALWLLSPPLPAAQRRVGRLSARGPPSVPAFDEARAHTRAQPLFPRDFPFLINEPGKCEAAAGGAPFLVILVSSAHGELDARRAIRETWGAASTAAVRVLTLFLLGRGADSDARRAAERESRAFGDVLAGDFVDSYRNLTLKTLTGLRWVDGFCPGARYVLKTDSDVFVNTPNLLSLLRSAAMTRYVAGHVIRSRPIRDKRSKWYMPRELYPDSRYPPFCSGTGYVFSADVAGLVVGASRRVRLLPLEDVYVGLCLRRLGVAPVADDGFNRPRGVDEAAGAAACRYRRALTVHGVSPGEMRRAWSDVDGGKRPEC